MVAFLPGHPRIFLWDQISPVLSPIPCCPYLYSHFLCPIHYISFGGLNVHAPFPSRRFQESRSIRVLLSSLQFSLYNNIHLSHWWWNFFALLLVDCRFSLAILSELPHDLPVYMRLFACRDRILRWFRLSTAPIGCACLSPLGSTTLFLGLVRSNITSLIVVLGCFLLSIFQAFFFSIQDFPYHAIVSTVLPLFSSQHPSYNWWVFVPSSHISHHYPICLVQ